MDKSAIVAKAQKLSANGQLDKAIEEWQKLIRETPNDGNIYNTIGDLQLKRNLPQKAVDAYLKGAEAFQGAGFELKTIAVYKKVIKIDPSRLDVYEKLADLNAIRGMTANATEEYHRIAKQYGKLGNLKGALLIYQKLADLDGENVQARIKLAEMCLKEGFADQALEAFEKALEFYRSRNQQKEAEGVLKEIKKLRPDFEELAEAKSDDPPVSEAVPSLHGTDNLETELQKPEPEIQKEEIPEPIHSEEIPLSEDPVEVPAEPQVLAEEEPPAQPLPEMEEVVSEPVAQHLTAEEIQNRMTEAEVYVKYGLLEKATEQLSGLIRDAPDRPEAYLQLKEIYSKEGKAEKAVEIGSALAELYGRLGEVEHQNELLQELGSPGRTAPQAAQEDEGDAETPVTESLDLSEQFPDAGNPLEESASTEDSVAEGDLSLGDEGLEQSVTGAEAESPAETFEASRPDFDESTPIDDDTDRSVRSFDKILSDTDSVKAPPEAAEDDEALVKNLGEMLPEPGEGSGYFDLSSLLDDVDDGSPLAVPAPQAESELDTIFEEFQKSLHEQPSQEDVETHFNLGIAYREMGLFNEAINEFKQAMGGKRYIDAALMLSICYQQRGMPKESEGILRHLMTDSRCSDEQRLLIKYELGVILARENSGEASKLFREVYTIDPKFRDVAKKIGKHEPSRQADATNKRKARISYL